MTYLRMGRFYEDLYNMHPRSMRELWIRAQCWIEKIEAMDAKHRRDNGEKPFLPNKKGSSFIKGQKRSYENWTINQVQKASSTTNKSIASPSKWTPKLNSHEKCSTLTLS